LSVRERVYPVKGVHDIDTPRSRAVVRTIAIPRMLAEQLERHMEQLTDQDPSSPVFTAATGGNIRMTLAAEAGASLLSRSDLGTDC